jgi:hypothetical protein
MRRRGIAPSFLASISDGVLQGSDLFKPPEMELPVFIGQEIGRAKEPV